MLHNVHLRQKGIRIRLPKAAKIAAGLALMVLCAAPVAAFATDGSKTPKTHWKMIYKEDLNQKNYGVEIDVCDTVLNFSGNNHLENHLYQKFLGDAPQNAYHIIYRNTYEGRATAVVDGTALRLRLHRENSDRGFYSLAGDVEVFSLDHGLYDDTIRITNADGGILMLNFAKTYNLQPTNTKFVANCDQVPDSSPFKHHGKKK